MKKVKKAFKQTLRNMELEMINEIKQQINFVPDTFPLPIRKKKQPSKEEIRKIISDLGIISYINGRIDEEPIRKNSN